MELEYKWLSAKDNPPPKKGRYLTVCIGFKSAVVRFYDDAKWHSWQDVLYWMPLPKIPKVIKEEIKNENTKET